jgi:N-acetyl-anhydromuramyl-L-alanine amidase AmpD
MSRKWPFIQARNYHKGRKQTADLIVIHTMEAPEGPKTARNVANWFARTDRPASAHFCVDANEVIQCVKLADTAWAAPGANARGVQIELAGHANQTPEQWRDTYSDRMLTIAACVVAEVIVGFKFFGVKIPPWKLSAAEVARGAPGICGHVDVTRAFRKSTHTDPGPNFPWITFIDRVNWWIPHIDNIDWQ